MRTMLRASVINGAAGLMVVVSAAAVWYTGTPVTKLSLSLLLLFALEAVVVKREDRPAVPSRRLDPPH